jgi:hypothetical protein
MPFHPCRIRAPKIQFFEVTLQRLPPVKEPSMRQRHFISFVSALILILAACSDDPNGNNNNNNFTINQNPEIQVDWGTDQLIPGESSIAIPSNLIQGDQEVSLGYIYLTNNGNGPLKISDFSLTSTPEGAFRLELVEGDTLPSSSAPWTVMCSQPLEGCQGGEMLKKVQLMFTRPGDDVALGGSLTIVSSTNNPEHRTLVFPIEVADQPPEISVQPSTVDFGNVGNGDKQKVGVKIINTGGSDLIVGGFQLKQITGPNVFALIDGQGKWSASAETAAGVDFENPIVIAKGTSYEVKVEFAPEDPNGAEAELRFFSNDPATKGQGKAVALLGNVGGPCIAINPNKVDFGGKLIGKLATIDVQILSCGDAEVEINSLRLSDDPALSGDFELDLSGLGVEGGALNDGDTPIKIGINESKTFQVKFIPDEINAKDENGKPIPDLSFIEIRSNTFVPELEVEVRGFGVEVECPTAIIKIQEGEEVIPQTKLHLVGSQSYAATGNIAKYEWSVKQPPGSQSVFLPSNTAPDPTFEANVAGSYVFTLRVWDQENTPSCVDAEYQVIVNPDEAIHIELLWNTPNDPDQTDEGPEAGADLDLHFLHQFAMGLDVDNDGEPDGWFDNPFDCFWFNDEPNWASQDPMLDDDPSLDRDDTDGAGPENVNLNLPEEGMQYRIGVHYWNDHGWGPSLSTVRVYIMSVLVFQVTDVELVNHDMWYVATVHWPSGDVKPITTVSGGYNITPNYEHPLFLGE